MGAEYDDDEVAESVARYAPHAPVGSAELFVRVHGCGSWYVARRLHLSLSATDVTLISPAIVLVNAICEPSSFL